MVSEVGSVLHGLKEIILMGLMEFDVRLINWIKSVQ